MGAFLLLACTITLIIVVYIVYFKQKKINVYPYPPSYYPKFPNIYSEESYSYRKEIIPPSYSKSPYWNYSNRNMFYKNETNSKSPNNNFDYSIKAKLIQSPGFLLNKYRNDTALKNNDLNENINYINIPKKENLDKIKFDTTKNNLNLNLNKNNYRIINASDFLSQFKNNSSNNTTNNKKIILNTPVTSAFKSIFKYTDSSNCQCSIIQNKEGTIIESILKKNPEETRNIIKKLEFNEVFTSNKK